MCSASWRTEQNASPSRPSASRLLMTAPQTTHWVVERDRIVRAVEGRILGLPGIRHVYARSALRWQGGNDIDEDVVGMIMLEFTDWKTRQSGEELMAEVRRRTGDILGACSRRWERRWGS